MSDILMKGTEPIGQVGETPKIITNANGTAYKFDSGLMICTKAIAQNVSQSSDWTSWGSWYYAILSGGDWATSFISTPQISACNDSADAGFIIGDIKGVTKDGFTNIQIVRPNAPSLVVCSISVFAIGRWK